METSYEAELAGVVALGRMDCSMSEFARRVKCYLEEEQNKLSPDNGLIALLCDSARVGKELLDVEYELHKLKLEPSITELYQGISSVQDESTRNILYIQFISKYFPEAFLIMGRYVR